MQAALAADIAAKKSRAVAAVIRGDPDCPACARAITLATSAAMLQCGHLMHRQCSYHFTACPECREPIVRRFIIDVDCRSEAVANNCK